MFKTSCPFCEKPIEVEDVNNLPIKGTCPHCSKLIKITKNGNSILSTDSDVVKVEKQRQRVTKLMEQSDKEKAVDVQSDDKLKTEKSKKENKAWQWLKKTWLVLINFFKRFVKASQEDVNDHIEEEDFQVSSQEDQLNVEKQEVAGFEAMIADLEAREHLLKDSYKAYQDMGCFEHLKLEYKD